MTNEQAIKVLLDEWKCIDRNDGINCDRQCEKCDLVMDSAILKDAYNIAIQALSQELCEWGKMTFDAISGMSIFEFSDGTVKRVKQAELEPCEDAISRDAVIKIIEDAETARLRGDIDLLYAPILKKLNELTSVNPQPCDDAISRDMALEKMADYVASGYADSAEDFEEYSRIICQLPSVNPQAKEQEPCGNAISRQAAIDGLKGCICEEWTKTLFATMVKQLPSVNPQPSEHFINGVHAMGYREGYKDAQKQKLGKWITKPHVYGVTYCSECDFELKIDDTNYCPNCGAKMESEG